MAIFTATLSLIITVVVALAGVATSSGSIHPPGGHFVLSGHQVSSLSAGKLFPPPIVVRIAGLLGFSMLLGACTSRLTSRKSQRVLAGSRHETTALRLDRDRLAGEPIQRSRAHIGRPGRGLAGCCGSDANIMIKSGSAARTAVGRNSGRCGTADRWCPASGVTAGELVDDERFTSAHISTLDSLHSLGARATLEALMAQLPGESTSAAGAGSSSPAGQLKHREKAASCLPTHRRPRRL
jgi:hypothetical protein